MVEALESTESGESGSGIIKEPQKLFEILQGEEKPGSAFRQGTKLEGRFCDHPECALTAGQQLPEVVSSIVFFSITVDTVEGAVHGDHRQSEDPIAGVSVTDDPDAAGVGGDVPSDGG